MTVKDLIELNALITDLKITVRQNGNLLLDQLNIGCSEGVEPRYPTRVPRDPKYAENFYKHDEATFKDAAYIPKPINAWDEGKDYYDIRLGKIPKQWLDLEVYSWECYPASKVGTTSPRRGRTNFHGQCLWITALPSGAKLEIKETEKPEEELPGQMSIEEMLKE